MGDKGTFYLDPNGIIIAKDVTAATTVDDALYVVTAWDTDKTEYGVKTVTTSVQVVDMNGVAQDLVVGTKEGDKDQKGIAKTDADKLKNTIVKATYDSDDKVYELEAWAATDYQTSQTIAAKTELKASSTKAGTVRLTSDTKYIIVEDSGADLDVTVKTGGINFTLDKEAKTITKTSTGNYVAHYVIIPTDKYTSSSAADLLYVDAGASYETVKVDGTTRYSYTVYNTKGEEVSIVATDYPGKGTATAGFHKYTVDKNDVYTLSNPGTALTLTSAYDDESGYKTGLIFKSYYGTLLTSNTTYFEDIETENAKFIDLRDLDTAAYGKKVASLEAMKSADDAKYDVTFSVYLDDGATVIFITNVAKKAG